MMTIQLGAVYCDGIGSRWGLSPWSARCSATRARVKLRQSSGPSARFLPLESAVGIGLSRRQSVRSPHRSCGSICRAVLQQGGG